MQIHDRFFQKTLLAAGLIRLIGVEAGAQSINIDFGDLASAPTAAHGAAGLAGTWNAIGKSGGAWNLSADANA